MNSSKPDGGNRAKKLIKTLSEFGRIGGNRAGVVYEAELPAGLLRARVECRCDSEGGSAGGVAHKPSGRPWQLRCQCTGVDVAPATAVCGLQL